MNRFHFVIRTAAATFLLAGAINSAGVAQPVEIAAPAQTSAPKAPQPRLIQVRNVSADMMAWWLDPVRNTVPLEVAMSYEASKRSGQSAPERLMPEMQEDIYASVEGLISFASIAPQNALMAYGSEEGIRRFEEIVKSLDKPVTQVEISTQFIQISPADAASLNIDLSAAPENARANANQLSKPRVGFARGDTQVQVDALVQQGKARVLNAPRVTMLNNLTAQLVSMSVVPAVLGVRDQAGELKPVFDSTQDGVASPLHIGTMRGLVVTPSIQNHDVISLNIGPYRSLHVVVHDPNYIEYLRGRFTIPGATPDKSVAPKKSEGRTDTSKGRGTETFFLKNLESELGTFKVRDGETLVLTGLNWASDVDDIVNQGMATQNPTANVICLVTPRILRRAEATPIALHRVGK